MKFRLGYPIDGGYKDLTNSYIIVARLTSGTNLRHSCKGGRRGSQLRVGTGAEFVWERVPEIIDRTCAYELEQIPMSTPDITPANLNYSGYSDATACALAVAQYNLDSNTENNSPLILVSCSLGPSHHDKRQGLKGLSLEKVSTQDMDDSIRSLRNKWELAHTNNALALVLHEEDAKLLSESYKITITPLQKDIFKELAQLEAIETHLVSCKTTELTLLAEALECDSTLFDKIEGEEESQKSRIRKDISFKKTQDLIKDSITIHLNTYEDREIPKESGIHPLNWSRYFAGRSVKEPGDWEKMFQELKEVRGVLDKGSRILYAKGKACLPAWITLGYVFPATSGYKLLLSQLHQATRQEEIWRSDEDTSGVKPKIEFVPIEIPSTIQPEENNLIVCISPTNRDVDQAVERYIKVKQLKYRGFLNFTPIEEESPTIKDGKEAVAIAEFVGKKIKIAWNKYGPKTVHLFYSGPLALATFIGQHISVCDGVLVYQHNGADYDPSFLLKSPFSHGKSEL